MAGGKEIDHNDPGTRIGSAGATGGDLTLDEEIAEVRSVLLAGSPACAAFDYLLAQARAADFELVCRVAGAVKAVEFQRPDKKRNPFAAQAARGHVNFYLRVPILAEHPGLFAAAERRFGGTEPNKKGEFRTRLHTVDNARRMLDFLREQNAWPRHRHAERFLAEAFRSITGEHLLRAAERLADGFTAHGFGASNKFDLLFEGHRLPPKAVFGVAASEALGFPVGPENFSGGESTTAFRILRAHGYSIVGKDDTGQVDPALVSDEDRSWAEGRLKLVAHLRRERGSGLASAKRDQFRALHGRLFCERCAMDPVDLYGEAGEACIEVHHHGTHIAAMGQSHRTKLEDLQCLCANCHRVTHRELKAALPPTEVEDDR